MFESKDLEKLGLSSNEAKVYLVLLELNQAPVGLIAKKSGINRVTCYNVLEYLRGKELIVKIVRNRKMYFMANKPIALKRWVCKEKKIFEKREDMISELLPDLNGVYTANVQKPNLLYYDGLAGIQEVLEDSIESKPETIYLYSSPEAFSERLGVRYLKKIAKKKIQLRITQKVFVPKSMLAESIRLSQKYYNQAGQLHEIRAFDMPHKVKNEIQLYKNKISMLNYDQDNLFGMILENPFLYQLQVAVFKSLWKKSKKNT